MKKYKLHILLLIWVALTPIIFSLADYLRGYDATGGELVWLFMPVLVWIIWEVVKESKQTTDNKEISPDCATCKKQHAMECPNSFYCYSRESKPYYTSKKKHYSRKNYRWYNET